MTTSVVHFLAIVLTALAMVPGGAHLLELPAKIGMDREAYFTVQQIYRGWALSGAVIFAAIAANLWAGVRRRRQPAAFRLAIAAAGLIVLSLAIFFTWTYPANQATMNWTTVTEDWAALRARWELSHALNAAIMLAAFCCSVLAALTRRD